MLTVLGANLGVTADGRPVHDGGACLLGDGVVVAGLAEERITRNKHCGGYENAARSLLRAAGLAIADIDLMVLSCYGEEPRLDLFQEIPLSGARRIAMIPSHHLSHAYSAFLPSGFSEALVLIADNEGGILGQRRFPEVWRNALERVSVYRGRGIEIQLLERDMDQEDVVSLGELYGNITRFLGFQTYLNAGKTMALAALGDPGRFAGVPLIERLPDGRVRCPLRNEYLNSSAEIRRYFESYGHHLPPERTPDCPITSTHADLAAAAQRQLEDALLHKVRYWVGVTGIRYLCLAGGVALNCVANQRLLEDVPLDGIYIQPNAGDQGQGLGNALYGWHEILGREEPVCIPGVYLGNKYSNTECLAALEGNAAMLSWRTSPDVCRETAEALAGGAVVGWFQGRSEWGPRALGNRSILADPRDRAMKDRVNRSVKHREPFRPFAPAVPLECANDYFELRQPASYMTVSAKALPHAVDLIPAVVHTDGTARIQTVTAAENPLFHRLLQQFGAITRVPVLLNTSFNDNDEPMVETPADAVRCLFRSQMHVLVMNQIIAVKRR